MATNKSFTSLEQSRKLAEILPIKSADMYYSNYDTIHANTLYSSCDIQYFNIREYIPCWSLAALLSILPDGTDIVKDKSDTENEKYMCTVGVKDGIISTFGNNPVDACVAMVEKLNELNLL